MNAKSTCNVVMETHEGIFKLTTVLAASGDYIFICEKRYPTMQSIMDESGPLSTYGHNLHQVSKMH